MKSLKIGAVLVFSITLILTSCKKEESKAEISQKSEQIAKTEITSFEISGMTCEMGCAKTIENKLANLEGVQNVKVDFKSKTATIQYDAAKQTPEKFVETVEAFAGGKTYTVNNVKNSADQASLYQEPKQKKSKNKKENKDQVSAAANDLPVQSTETRAKCSTEKKAGCCSAKKTSCSSAEKPSSI